MIIINSIQQRAGQIAGNSFTFQFSGVLPWEPNTLVETDDYATLNDWLQQLSLVTTADLISQFHPTHWADGIPLKYTTHTWQSTIRLASYVRLLVSLVHWLLLLT